MAISFKHISLTALFVITAIVLMNFASGIWLTAPTISAATPPDGVWINATHTNSTIGFTLTLNSMNSSERCFFNRSITNYTDVGSAYFGLPENNTFNISGYNATVLNNTATTIYSNLSFVPGLYTWNFFCYNLTDSGNISADRRFWYDPNATTGTIIFPTANVNWDGAHGLSKPISVNMTEITWNSTNITGLWYYIGSYGNATLSPNITMRLFPFDNTTNVTTIAYVNVTAIFNLTRIFDNFALPYFRPGQHNITFCSNDSADNRNCTVQITFNISVANATAVKTYYNNFLPGSGASLINITNETGATITPTDLMSVANKGIANYTLQFNRTNYTYASVVGVMFDNSSINNITNFNLSIIQNANWRVNLTLFGYNSSEIAWMDLPADVGTADYKFGNVRMARHESYFYCNGTWASPSCFNVTQACTTTPNSTNQTAIPTGGACFVTTGNLVNIYTDIFSGVAGANDTIAPRVAINAPTAGLSINSSTLLNATITDIGSFIDNSSIYWRYENSTTNSTWYQMSNNTKINVSTVDFGFTINTTLIADGNYTLRINASDLAVAPNANTSITVAGLVFDYTQPSACTLTQLKTDTIRVGDSLTATDFSCTGGGDNIGQVIRIVSGFNTATEGTKTATCLQNDTAGNTRSCTTAYTVYARSSGGGGGGGGGGGAIGEQATTIVAGDIKAGETKVITGFDSKAGVEEISITPTTLVQGATAAVSSLMSKPAGIDVDLAGITYKYLEIKVPQLADANVLSADITFKVEKKWVADNALDKDSVVLARYKYAAPAGWQKLDTKYSKDDATYYYYKAKTPGFSYFAIAAEKLATGAPAVAPKTTSTAAEAAKKAAEAVKQLPTGQIVGAILLVLVIAAIGYVVTRQTKKKRWR